MAKHMSTNVTTDGDPRWAAVLARDRHADGTFYYSVKTTGVYCRPSCAARRPNPKNVSFHRSRADAERAGFRPCRRCRPDRPLLEQSHAATVANICRAIEAAVEMPSLAALAKRAGLSPYHFHRVFKAVSGVTPNAYAAAHRTKRVRNELRRSKTVTEAIYDAGFNSGGRFYEKSTQLLGMTPTSYRAGGTGTQIYFAVGECSLGSVLVARSAKGVCAILLGDDPDALVRDLQDRFPLAAFVGGDDAFEKVVAKVIGFIETPAVGMSAGRRFNGASGRLFARSRWAPRRVMPKSASGSARHAVRAPWHRHAPPTLWRWQFRAIGW